MELRLREAEYSYSDFINYIKYWQIHTSSDLRVLSYICDLSLEELLSNLSINNYSIKRLGEIFEITKVFEIEGKKDSAIYYIYPNTEKKLLLCFTSVSSEIVRRTMKPFIEHTPSLYFLWINPLLFDQLKQDILSQHPSTIIPYFLAKRIPFGGFEGKIREDYERSIEYRGEDGKQSLEEMMFHYGVLPRTIEYDIPNLANFFINVNGEFTFKKGKLDFVFEIINQILSRVLNTKKAIEQSKYEFIPIEAQTRKLKLVNVVPFTIQFSRSMDYDDIDFLLNKLYKEGFEVYDKTLKKGSVHVSGTVYDKAKGVIFDLVGDYKHLSLTPHDHVNFESILRFLQCIMENVDYKAEYLTNLA